MTIGKRASRKNSRVSASSPPTISKPRSLPRSRRANTPLTCAAKATTAASEWFRSTFSNNAATSFPWRRHAPVPLGGLRLLSTAWGQAVSNSRFEPDRLPREGEPGVTEVLPARTFGEAAQFAEGKRALGGETGVDPRHWFAKEESGEQVHTDR